MSFDGLYAEQLSVYKKINVALTGMYFLLALLFVLNVLRFGFNWGKDDTDPAGHGRSGLRLYTDHGTRVQYLRAGNAMFPRMNPDGSVVIKQD